MRNANKKFLTMAATVFALIAFAKSASAESAPAPSVVLRAELNRFELDEKLGLSLDRAEVLINRTEKTATLALYPRFRCPGRMFCAQVMPEPREIMLPLVSIKRDECGTRVYRALEDRRPMDGPLQVLEIRDNTKNHCPHLIALAPTEVRFQSASSGQGGKVIETTSTLSGEKLIQDR